MYEIFVPLPSTGKILLDGNSYGHGYCNIFLVLPQSISEWGQRAA